MNTVLATVMAGLFLSGILPIDRLLEVFRYKFCWTDFPPPLRYTVAPGGPPCPWQEITRDDFDK